MKDKDIFKRVVDISPDVSNFLSDLDERAVKKALYVIQIIEDLQIVSEKIVKKVKSTNFYELRIQVGNEYRIILFTIDHDNFMESSHVVLLHGFQKKEKKDYKKAIQKAENILQVYQEEQSENEEE